MSKPPIKSKAKAAEALQAAGIPVKSFSIAQFCGRHGFSEGFYRKLRRLEKGPRETRVLDRIFITDDDERAWLKARGAETAST